MVVAIIRVGEHWFADAITGGNTRLACCREPVVVLKISSGIKSFEFLYTRHFLLFVSFRAHAKQSSTPAALFGLPFQQPQEQPSGKASRPMSRKLNSNPFGSTQQPLEIIPPESGETQSVRIYWLKISQSPPWIVVGSFQENFGCAA